MFIYVNIQTKSCSLVVNWKILKQNRIISVYKSTTRYLLQAHRVHHWGVKGGKNSDSYFQQA